ncbi:MAG: peptidase [Bacteroidetes bacterium GWE2_29_8]|nr:MAG: peptidase [Bacteroidetes bacterium GWE2_29_8]OFY22075.1 MAG: peptidase [Bacteroidetes bacterium GWF2_29_10]
MKKLNNVIRKILTIIILLGLTIGNSYSQEIINTLKLDSLFKILDENNKFMGSIAISHNGKIIYSKTIGYDDIKTNKKSSINSKYRIGSISKMFTASLIFKAIEEKKIKLSQTIDKFFPSIENANKITISNLLNHRSGIYSFTDEKNYLKWNTIPKSENEMIEIIAKGKSKFEPDSKAEYSNSNYILLSYILEKIYNQSFNIILGEKIIKPLELKNTYLGRKININENECLSYKLIINWTKEPETDISIPLGAGGIVSNPIDLVKFIEELFAEKIINKKSLEQMTKIKDNYGMGIFQFPFYEKKGYGHTGGIDGFSSILAYFNDDDLAIALTSNATNFDNNNIVIGALSAYFNRPYDIPSFKNVELKSEDLDKYLGIYSSKQIPLKITINKENSILTAQASGQPSFSLNATDNDTFKFDPAGITIIFKTEQKQMILKQGTGEYIFNKE